MSYSLGSATVTSNPGSKSGLPNSGIQSLIIGNQSGYSLYVQMEGCGIAKTLYPGVSDVFPYQYGFTGTVFWTPTASQNVRNIPGATITFDAVGKAEKFDSSTYPMSIAVSQAVTATATGKPIYSATVGFGATTTVQQVINIFNPANSGVVAIFHAARVYTNDGSGPTANLEISPAPDRNLANAVQIVSHTAAANPPASAMHATSVDSTVPNGFPAVEVMNMQQNVTQDFLTFPDVVTLFPGENLAILLVSSTSSHVVRLTMKWTEDVAVPAVLITGGQAVASQIDSELLTLGTNLIKSVVPGPLTTYSITNDGVGVHSVDQSGTLHQVEKYNSAGNPFQLGQAGDITEILGQLTIDQLLTAIAGILVTGGSITLTGNAAGSLHLGQSATGDILDTNASDTFFKSANNIRFQVPNGTDIAKISSAGITLIAGTITLLAGGLSRIWVSAALSIAVAGTSVSHGLGAIPDFVVGTLDEGAAGSGVIGINYGTMTSTTFTAFASVASTCRFIAIKK